MRKPSVIRTFHEIRVCVRVRVRARALSDAMQRPSDEQKASLSKTLEKTKTTFLLMSPPQDGEKGCHSANFAVDLRSKKRSNFLKIKKKGQTK